MSRASVAQDGSHAAPMIPPEATGRDDVFFFGTLMHADVLARVLDRSLRPNELLPATLLGYRRVRALNASYPILVEAAESLVAGVRLVRPNRRDIERINHFEADEYEARRLTLEDGGAAWVFIGLDALPASNEPWDLDVWAVRHMPAYLVEVVDYWMADAN